MRVSEAIDLINGLAYKPNWRFETEDHTSRFQDTVKIKVHYPAFNSNRDQARNGYPESIMTYAVFALVVFEMDERDLYYALVQKILHIEEHEAREFLRIPERDFTAPFHPHRIHGMIQWDGAEHRAARINVGLASDLQFGVA